MFLQCPACEDGEKDVRLVGRTEWDTNVGPSLEIDPTYSCGCELTDEQEQDLYLRACEAQHERDY